MPKDNGIALLRGGGDLATGVALRLYRAGIRLMITELAQPLAVRRAVSFAEAVYESRQTVEGVTARLVEPQGISDALEANEIPVLIDPNADVLTNLQFSNHQLLIVIDARLTKQPPSPLPTRVPLHIGLGPGFHAGTNCDAAIETRLSYYVGRVFFECV
jgi:xanthine dehydrogenase accessory factor